MGKKIFDLNLRSWLQDRLDSLPSGDSVKKGHLTRLTRKGIGHTRRWIKTEHWGVSPLNQQWSSSI